MEIFCFVEKLWSSFAVEVNVLNEGNAPVRLYQLLVWLAARSGSGSRLTILAETGLIRPPGITLPGN
jgi:hypothetical protein